MRKVEVSQPTSSGAGLSLSLDYIAAKLQLPSPATLLQIDQTRAEQIFPALLSKLQLNHVRDLVAMRQEERKDGQMATKIGSIGARESQASKAEEDQYRAVFTQLIIQQALKLGFKGVINPGLTSLVTDKKLTLRIIDHLTKRCFGLPQTSTPLSDRSPQPIRRANRTTNEPTTASSSTAASLASSTASSAVNHRYTADDSLLHSQSSRRELPNTTPGSNRSGQSSQLAQSSSPATHSHPTTNTTWSDDEPNESDDDHALAVARPTYDGRFADKEYESPTAAIDAAVAARKQRTAAHQPSSSRPFTQRTSHTKQKSRIPEEDMTADELRAELVAERGRHHQTALQLQSITGMYEQLLVERGEEKFGARRVTLLKAQNMQLERQLSLLSDSMDTKRGALNEINTIVNGLENAVGNEIGDGTATNGILPNSQRELVHLQVSLEAAKQRLSKYERNQLQFSANEEQYLQSDAPLTTDSLYAGTITHLNLERVHALESSLAELHETCLKTHSLLSGIAATAPIQYQLTQFLQKRPNPSSSNPSSSVLRLQSLLDALRTAAFELASLGVLLPSNTAFPQSHLTPPTVKQHQWSWIPQLQQALKRKGIPAAVSDMIMKRAVQEENYVQIKMRMYEEELNYFRRIQQIQISSVLHLLQETEDIIAQFHLDGNSLYASAHRELTDCINDWSRNSHQINVERFLTLLQSIFPCVRQLLHHDQKAPISTSSNLPPMAAQFQTSVDVALRHFQTRLSQLEEDQTKLQTDIQAMNSANDSISPLSARTDQRHEEEYRRNESVASHRSTAATHSHSNSKTDLANRPPFQF